MHFYYHSYKRDVISWICQRSNMSLKFLRGRPLNLWRSSQLVAGGEISFCWTANPNQTSTWYHLIDRSISRTNGHANLLLVFTPFPLPQTAARFAGGNYGISRHDQLIRSSRMWSQPAGTSGQVHGNTCDLTSGGKKQYLIRTSHASFKILVKYIVYMANVIKRSIVVCGRSSIKIVSRFCSRQRLSQYAVGSNPAFMHARMHVWTYARRT